MKGRSLCLVTSHAKISLVHHWARLSLRSLCPKSTHPGRGLWLTGVEKGGGKHKVNLLILSNLTSLKQKHLLYTKSLLIPCLSIHAIGWYLPAIRHVLTILLRIAIHLIPVSPLSIFHLEIMQVKPKLWITHANKATLPQQLIWIYSNAKTCRKM